MTTKMLSLTGFLIIALGLLPGCASEPAKPPELTLRAPSGTLPAALAALNEGNRRFAEGRWGAAKALYDQAIRAQPDLAEAHYNLALTLERLGEPAQARDHYIEAANLAPGHKVIWDSPPLRRFGNVKASPKSSTTAPVLPALGGGGLGGLGGRGY